MRKGRNLQFRETMERLKNVGRGKSSSANNGGDIHPMFHIDHFLQNCGKENIIAHLRHPGHRLSIFLDETNFEPFTVRISPEAEEEDAAKEAEEV